ncbi:ATP-dependent RNA helicase DDX24 [Ostrinia nubilalis]|uniref:ATP-dependent RNA helicase DDX24 n=1 Tax=Ostrinia nubilalis TaxID=29057 RepID=UPI00308268DD
MSKKLYNLKWQSVALEGFPVSMSDKFQGFVGLEECTSYGLDKELKSRKKKKQTKKRRNEDTEISDVAPKRVKKDKKKEIAPKAPVKLSNGFIVESCNVTKPSTTNEVQPEKNKTKKQRRKNKKNKKKTPENPEENPKEVKNKSPKKNNSNNKKSKPKLGENMSETVSDLTPEDMLTWAEFKLPEPIMKALTELGFKKPTKIQELSLPAAIHGRRDILGAAETGSGKTLAFGLPILTGIIRLKEKAELKGLDVYDIPYKKTSMKRKYIKPEPVKKKGKVNKKKQEKRTEQKAKESSEDGYGSDEENSDSEQEENKTSEIAKKCAPVNKSKNETSRKVKPTKNVKKSNDNVKEDDDYVEEIVVPIKRKETSADEGNDSDDSSNYIHLSEMFDSDDLAASSDDENDKTVSETENKETDNSDTESADESNSENSNDETQDEIDEDSDEESQSEINDDEEESVDESEDDDDDENDEDTTVNESDDDDDDEIDEDTTINDDENPDANDEKSIESGSDEDDEEMDEGNENEQGIGCVKVIDNIEIPGHVVVKTGKPLYALILTPTRELAIQISRHLIAVAKYTGIRIATIVGGMAAVKQERVLRSGPEVVVATPGRLWELISQGQPHLQQLDCVKFLAIDETDRMVERNHFEELEPLLERLNADEERSRTRQNFVFSATLTMVHDLPAHMRGKKVTKRGKIINRKVEKMTPQQKIKRLVAKIGMTDPKVVDITTQNLGTAETLTESRIACAIEHKDAYLYYILKRHPGRTIVFCNSIGSVKRLAQLFSMLKCHPLPLHASMPQRQRLKNLEKFRDDPHGVLIATDVAARGLDIPDVDHVIHYQVPRTAENYVHRSGRTARACKEGLTILMMEPSEAFLYSKLCRTLNKTSEVPTFPVPPQQLAPLKDLVSVARDLDSLTLQPRPSEVPTFPVPPQQLAPLKDLVSVARDLDSLTLQRASSEVPTFPVPPQQLAPLKDLVSVARDLLDSLTLLPRPSEVPTFPVPPQQLAPLKDLVSVARDLDSLTLQRRRASQAAGWRERAAREMDMIIDDDDLPVKEVDPSIDKALQAKKRQLESMLTRPLFPKGFSFKYPTLNDPAVFAYPEENALQVMKKALESGELKKEKRKSKNSSLLKLSLFFYQHEFVYNKPLIRRHRPVKEVDPSIDKALQAKKRQLESMLTRPLFPKGFSFKYPTLNDPAVFAYPEENALQVMKKALESGELKKEKRKSKNSSLLKLQKRK